MYSGAEIEAERRGVEKEYWKNRLCLPVDGMPLLRECAFCKSEEGFVHPNRVLDFNVLLYVVSGSVQVVEDGQEYCVQPGELLFLRQGCHHYGTKKNPPMTSWYYYHFYLPEQETRRGFQPFEHLMHARGMDREDYQIVCLLPKLLRIDTHAFTAQLQALCRLHEARSPYDRMTQNVTLCNMLLEIYRQSEEDKNSSLNRKRTRQMLDYLEEHCEESFSSAALEAYMGLSYKHLNELFKQETGTTLQKYHSRMRIERAARLLQQTELGITQISEQLGFEEVFYFSNAFKKQMKVSPTTYRKGCVRI